MRNALKCASAVESMGAGLDSAVRPIGEVMPLVLARYGAGSYQFYRCDERPPQRDSRARFVAEDHACLLVGS